MNRWNVYELLKTSSTAADITEIEKMDKEELREGTIEYLMALKRDKKNKGDKRDGQ